MNKCFFIGRTTKEPELRYSQDGQTAICSSTIAVDDGWGDKKSTSFFDLTIFNKRAESFSKMVRKGTKIAVEARAKQNSWTTKEGQKRYSIGFLVDNWEFAQGKADSEEKPSTGEDANWADMPMDSLLEELPFN